MWPCHHAHLRPCLPPGLCQRALEAGTCQLFPALQFNQSVHCTLVVSRTHDGSQQTRIGKSTYTLHDTRRLESQDCLLCKSIWLALRVDSMCVESLWFCTCHHAHLLPCMPKSWPVLRRHLKTGPTATLPPLIYHANMPCACIFSMMYKVATAAFTSLLMHKSIAFEHMFLRLQF